MRTTIERGGRRWIDRILATGIALVLALQPVVRAGSTSAPSASGSPRACCCSSERVMSCCRRPFSHDVSGLPTLRREACGCDLRAPIAPLALPGTAEAREVKSNGSAWAQGWIADGARVSEAAPIAWIGFGPDPPGSADESPLPTRRDSSSTLVCTRGIHALLASFGTLLR